MNKLKLNEIARAFGFTILQFAECIGYSRQALYLGIRPSGKAKAAIAKLRSLNASMLKVEQEETQRRFEAREKAVKEFEKLINGVSADD